MRMANLRNLDNLPETSHFDAYVWVDYIEMLCLFNADKVCSKADILDRVRERGKDLGETPADTENELDEEDESTAEIDDKWSVRADNWFAHLSYRSACFGDAYPFYLSTSGEALHANDTYDLKQKLYISLLLSSCLGRWRKYKPQLTSSFELLSAEAIKTYLPPEAEVHVFGTSALEGSRFLGNVWTKINLLANDLKETVTAKERDFPPTDSGDNGLDIVAWIRFGDKDATRGMLIVFGQCACTEEWDVKQFSSSWQKWDQVMTYKAHPNNMVFIPLCLRDVDGEWHRDSDIACILVDRLRFIHLLRDKLSYFKKMSSYKSVEEIIKLQEDIV